MPRPARRAGTAGGAKAPTIAAALLAVAALTGGCAPGSGDLGRPRPLLHPAKIEAFIPPATLVEREREDRLVHFRHGPAALPNHSAAATFNALRDRIETDRALLPPLRAALAGSADKQRIRAVALDLFPSIDPQARQVAEARIAEDRAAASALCPLLRERAESDRALLETHVARAPEMEAIAAERSLVAFEGEISVICGGGAATPAPLRARVTGK